MMEANSWTPLLDEEPVLILDIDEEKDIEKDTQDPDEDFDNVDASYLADVRKFDLLGIAKERALWQRIESAKKRERRTLYMSPAALSTLMHVRYRVEQETIALDHVLLRDAEVLASQHDDLREQFKDAVRELQDIATCVQTLRSQKRVACQRRVYARLWQQWCKTWEALALHPHVYETLGMVLKTEHAVEQDNLTLQAAHRAWQHAHERLIQLKAAMIEANLRLVISVANRFRGRGLSFLDLIQEGNIGLMRALEKFESSRELKFITYAHWWVRQAISRAITDQAHTIRRPNHLNDRQNQMHAMARRLCGQYGCPPTNAELATACGLTLQQIEELQAIAQPTLRLHQPLTESGKVLADVLKDEQAPEPDKWLVADQLQRSLSRCLADLTEREALVIRLRYGLESEEPKTLQEIAHLLGKSRERIRQVEKKAFEKLRQPHRSAGLREFL